MLFSQSFSYLCSFCNGTQVHFSQGNLQYIGSAPTPYWKFADHQWDCFRSTTGQSNNNTSPTIDRDLFAWGTSGYDHGAVYYQPYNINGSNNCYYAYGNKRANLYDQTGKADWGYNAISNGGNIEHLWRHPDSRTRLHVLLQQPRTENLDHQRGKSPTVTIFALSQLGQSS